MVDIYKKLDKAKTVADKVNVIMENILEDASCGIISEALTMYFDAEATKK